MTEHHLNSETISHQKLLGVCPKINSMREGGEGGGLELD